MVSPRKALYKPYISAPFINISKQIQQLIVIKKSVPKWNTFLQQYLL